MPFVLPLLRAVVRSPHPPARLVRAGAMALLVAGLLVATVVPPEAAAWADAPGSRTSTLGPAGGGGLERLRAEPAAPAAEGRLETVQRAASAHRPLAWSASPAAPRATHPTPQTAALELRADAAAACHSDPEPQLSRPPPSSV